MCKIKALNESHWGVGDLLKLHHMSTARTRGKANATFSATSASLATKPAKRNQVFGLPQLLNENPQCLFFFPMAVVAGHA